MTIEFQCPGCGQTLKAPDTAAGKKAKCPQCQQIAPIPNPAAAPPPANNMDDFFAENLPTNPQPGFDPVQQGAEQFPGFVPGHAPQAPEPKPAASSAYSNPYASPEALAASDGRGNFGGPVVPTAVDATAAFSAAWEVWKSGVGYLILCNIVMGIISNIIQYAGGFVVGLIFGIAGLDQEMLPLALIPVVLIALFVQIYLQAGIIRIQMDMMRGQPFDFGRMFSASDKIFPLIGASILFYLLFIVGLALLIIPGIIISLAMWPFMYLIVDDKAGAVESLGMSWEIGKGNILTTFVLGLFAVGIIIIGILACFVGVLAAVPLVQLMMTACYLMMIGELKQ